VKISAHSQFKCYSKLIFQNEYGSPQAEYQEGRAGGRGGSQVRGGGGGGGGANAGGGGVSGFSCLKGLYHEIELVFDDIYGLF
jgi:hypothetical protein